VGAATLVPGRLASAADGARASAAVEAPRAQGGQALILVHGSWSSRVAARLAATGMRRDSVETALRRNDLCRVQVLATAREEGGTVSGLELEPLPGSPPTLRPVEISPGNRVLLDPARTLTPECTRQARADATAGTLELEPLLWRTPPLSGRGTLVARDLGPEGNRDLLEAHPGRTPWLLVSLAGGGVRLLPYGEAMARVWGVRDGG